MEHFISCLILFNSDFPWDITEETSWRKRGALKNRKKQSMGGSNYTLTALFNQLWGRYLQKPFAVLPSLSLKSTFLIALVKLGLNLVFREAYSFIREVYFSQLKETRHRQPKSVREKKHLARAGGILLINNYAIVNICATSRECRTHLVTTLRYSARVDHV